MAAFSGKLTSRPPPLWTSPLKIPQHDSVQSLIFHSELLFFRVNDLERDFSRLFKWFWPLSVCSCRDDYFSISAIALVFFLQPIHRMETVQRFFSFFIQTPPPHRNWTIYWLTDCVRWYQRYSCAFATGYGGATVDEIAPRIRVVSRLLLAPNAESHDLHASFANMGTNHNTHLIK